MNNNISERELKVIELYNSGMIQSKIGSKLKMCKKTVGKILKTNNVPKYTRTINCNWCDKEFTTEYRHQNSCSESCRGMHNKRNNGTTHKCGHCGNSYKGYKERLNCTDQCRDDEENKKKAMDILCSTINAITYIKECKWCKDKFVARKINTTTCSSYCGRRLYRSNNPDMFNKRKKRMKANGRYDRGISVQKLVKMHKGTCYLCGDKVDMRVHYTKSEYGSVDHIRPISKGGTHTWDNINLAHRGCNSRKHDNYGKEEQEYTQSLEMKTELMK